MKKNEIAIIEWLDPRSSDAWATEEEELETLTPLNCTTVGFVLVDTKDHIIAHHTISDEDTRCGGLIIPKGCIKSIRMVNQ